MINEPDLTEFVDHIRGRFYGKYRGTITEVDTSTRRIKARVPAVLGDQPTGWCQHCVPFAGNSVGMLFLPEIGSGVWIEFEAGNVSQPIWTGCYWRKDEIPSEATATVKAIITKSGHKMLFDDESGSITIADANGNKIVLDASGITLSRGAGQVQISDAEVNVNSDALKIT